MSTYVKSVYQTLEANNDGSTTVFGIHPDALRCDGRFLFHVSGDFGSGTLNVEFLAADGTWKGITRGSFAAPDDTEIMLKPATKLRIVLTGATAPSLYYQVDLWGAATKKVFYII